MTGPPSPPDPEAGMSYPFHLNRHNSSTLALTRVSQPGADHRGSGSCGFSKTQCSVSVQGQGSARTSMTVADLDGCEDEIGSLGHLAKPGQGFDPHQTAASQRPVGHQGSAGLGPSQRGTVGADAADPPFGQVDDSLRSRRRPSLAPTVQGIGHEPVAFGKGLEIAVAVTAAENDDLSSLERSMLAFILLNMCGSDLR